MTQSANLVSCGNVYADVGMDDADGLMAKSNAVWAISDAIESGQATKEMVAALLHVDVPTLTSILDGQFRDVSLKTLLAAQEWLNVRLRRAGTSRGVA